MAHLAPFSEGLVESLLRDVARRKLSPSAARVMHGAPSVRAALDRGLVEPVGRGRSSALVLTEVGREYLGSYDGG